MIVRVLKNLFFSFSSFPSLMAVDTLINFLFYILFYSIFPFFHRYLTAAVKKKDIAVKFSKNKGIVLYNCTKKKKVSCYK